MSEVIDQVQPVAPSLKPLVLPNVVVRLVDAAKVTKSGDAYTVSYEGDVIELHEQDFKIVVRSAQRIRAAGANTSTKLGFMGAMDLARKFVCEEIFKPGAVRVLYFHSPIVPGSAFYRCILPTTALNRGTRVTAHLAPPGTPMRQALDFDIVVFQLSHDDATRRAAAALQEMGKKVVFEIDDAFDCLEPWHTHYAAYSQPARQELVRSMMGQADLVTVTTQWMKDRYAGFARRIEIVPNFVDLSDWPVAKRRNDGVFRVLWAGSPSHAGDLAVAQDALSVFANRNPDVEVVFFGMAPADNRIPEAQVEILPFVDLNEYPNRLADVGADIAIAPIADIPFNHAKSPVKVLEYCATGYPVVASDVGPYRIIEHGKSGMLCSNKRSGDWIEALEKLYASKDLRMELVANGTELARKYDVDANRSAIEDVFVSLGRAR